MIYVERRFWSILLDCQAARLSVADEHGSEFFAIIPLASEAKWRDLRSRALDAIEDAMAAGRAPGEITLCAEDLSDLRSSP